VKELRRFLACTRGAVAVEFALLLPVFLMLVFGIVEMGQAWYHKQMLVNASREGARLGSMLNDDTNRTSDVVAMVQDFLNQSGYPDQFWVSVSGANGNPGTQVRVTVSSPYQMPILSNLVGSGLATLNLTATTIMRHE